VVLLQHQLMTTEIQNGCHRAAASGSATQHPRIPGGTDAQLPGWDREMKARALHGRFDGPDQLLSFGQAARPLCPAGSPRDRLPIQLRSGVPSSSASQSPPSDKLTIDAIAMALPNLNHIMCGPYRCLNP
jgi:hypothetical protein